MVTSWLIDLFGTGEAARIIQLFPKYLASKEDYAKVRLELGRELRKLQDLHAKPGCGTFVETLKELRRKINISQSTAYSLIAESEIADGFRQKADKKSAPKPAVSLSKPRKDESNAREQNFTIIAQKDTFLRLSCVYYFRTGILNCGSPAQEIERVEAREMERVRKHPRVLEIP